MKEFVKKVYGSIAKGKKPGCCCGPTASSISEKIGYTKEELGSIPDEADMGLGCGNPVAMASLKEGETVVDLGSGGGIDVFLAAKRVGDKGRAIGIDMTEDMLEVARRNAANGGFKNVEFKLGNIESLPLDGAIADCVISNCVINLAEDKQRVFNETFRILKPGGRLMVSDMVLLADLPEKISKSAEMYAGCVAGALKRGDYLDKIKKAGFKDIKILKEDPVRLSDYIGSEKVPGGIIQNMSVEEINRIDKTVVSLKISAKKP